MTRLILILPLLACTDIKELGGGAGLDLSFLPGVGQVFQCQTSDNQTLELCYRGEPDELAASLTANGFGDAECGATPRHLGPCLYCCSDDCGRGANAYMGCWCES